ncbi:HNH endonuclease [Leucobacter ruminantium]|uniref:HNH endonuclease n=1 Tax=Leucobacter ruminantium TaxID=1289170 RepID=A0A939LZF3_9MICO|nr:HNH endonuclease [Leucobacter ruminantium]
MAEWGGRRAQAYTAEVLETYGTICRLCGLDGADTADHIVPRSKGGDLYDITNGRPAHLSCNSSRGNRDVEVKIESGLAFFKTTDT